MDLTVLDSDRGSVPMNIGAILEFDSQTVPSLDTVQAFSARGCPELSDCVRDCFGRHSDGRPV